MTPFSASKEYKRFVVECHPRMRAVIQRVKKARVLVEEEEVSSIPQGLLIFVAVGREDGEKDVDYIARKISELRVFGGNKSHFERSLSEAGGEVLLVSQFTLYGDCRRGRRPDFHRAASPEKAREFLSKLRRRLEEKGLVVKEGEFGAHMLVEMENDGPVTLLLDSGKEF